MILVLLLDRHGWSGLAGGHCVMTSDGERGVKGGVERGKGVV
jgi:hypothetical protein